MVNKDENILKCTPCGQKYCPSDFDEHTSSLSSMFRITTRNHTSEVTTTHMLAQLSMANKITEFVDSEWVNAYCLSSSLQMQVQYFPFIVLLMAISLGLVQKISNL